MDESYEPNPTFDFPKEKEKYDRVISDFNEENTKIKVRREIRENRKNVLEERQKKTILKDETIIPDRTVNTNIRIGRAPYVNYITQAKRILIITPIDTPDISVETLELWFSRGMKYPDWKFPWIRLVDCMHTHGGAALEVMYDVEKPFNVTIEYIARDSLIFPKKTRYLQGVPHLLRKYELTTLQLEEFSASYAFDPSITKEILDKHLKNDEFITVYRALCKKQGMVYNSWYSQECDRNYLRAPQLHDIGLFDFDPSVLQTPSPISGQPLYLSPEWDIIKKQLAKPLPLKQYPIIWFPYELTENETLIEGQGRVALDVHVQEALTHLLTNTVNATRRASSFYPCLKNDPTQDNTNIELQPIEPGVVYPRELAQYQPNWPNNIILAVMQAMRVEKSQEAGHSDFAAMARKDANKTATEMQLATDQAQSNMSTDMDIYSSPVLKTWALCFNVACHQAIFGLCKRPSHPDLLIGDYNLAPAGDVEVVKRAEDKQNAKEFFNIVQGTPAAEKILSFLIERFFPDQADAWLQALAGPDKDAIIMQLLSVLQTIPTDELAPDQQSALAALIQSASSVVSPGNNSNTAPISGAPQPANPQPSVANSAAA